MRLLPAQVGLVPEVSAILIVGTNTLFTVMTIALEVAVVGLAHDALEVRIHVTLCPLVIAVDVKVGLLEPTGFPATNHW